MQDTILKYINILGDYSFKEFPFNDVDALIFSLISYVNLPIKNGITIKEARNLIYRKFNLKKKDTFIDKTKMLFDLLGTKDRYKDLVLEDYTKINTKDEQFGAITIRLDKHTIFISFEGTEDNLVGWEEDFKMCYLYPVLAQESAMKYLKKHATLNNFNIYIGGHSKGGNLSMAAGLSANFLTRFKIKKIYNFDGPGFLSEIVNSKNFKKIQKKIITYIPEESIVGILLDNTSDVKVIKSYAKKSMSHDAFTWQCFGGMFINGNLSDYSYNIDRKVRQIIGKYNTSERKLFVSTFFRVLYNSGYTEKSELNKIDFNKTKNIIKEMYKLSSEEKKILLNIIKIFLRSETKDE